MIETVQECDIPLRVTWPEVVGASVPVRFGVPCPRGAVRGKNACGMLLDSAGSETVAQVRVTGRWSDGSARWLLVDAVLTPSRCVAGDWRLRISEGIVSGVAQAMSAGIVAGTVVIESSTYRLEIAGSRDGMLRAIGHDGRPFVIDSNWLSFVDANGNPDRFEIDSVEIDETGPVLSTVRLTGRLSRHSFVRLESRVGIYRDTGLCRFAVTLHNSRRALHRGGIWDLGDPGSLLFQDFSCEFTFPNEGARTIDASLAASDRRRPTTVEEWHLYQDSSGGENWRSEAHVNRAGIVPCRFRGYRLRAGGAESTGDRAEPTLVACGNSTSIGVTFPEFWQQFPKAIGVNCQSLRIGLFPREFDDLHELQGGEQKTHTFWLGFGDEFRSADSLLGNLVPVSVLLDREWMNATRVLAMPLPSAERQGRLPKYLEEAIDGPRGILANRERVNEYGWRNYGEIHADHEEQYYEGAEPLISHYNNQFDMVYGFLLHHIWSGEKRLFELGDALARHVIDIDVYRTQEDRAAYRGGLFWFTDHYLHAKTSSHRTYSQANCPSGGSYGGGPGAEHNFTSGLLLYHYLTGNAQAADTVKMLADWVIAMDDGEQSVYALFADGPTGPTGLASRTGSDAYHGPGRGGGNSINALLDAWTLSDDGKYLEYAERLIRRCIHPHDNIVERDLLNAEKRWSYTIFLTSLHKYVVVKAEADQIDGMHAYARESLLLYASWMLESERPYFERKEDLEYPTEAWAAQEFRKANVFRWAATHADEPLRSKLLGRGEAFADRAWDDLESFTTRTAARACAVVMVEGLVDSAFRTTPRMPQLPACSPTEFGRPERFDAQAVRAKRSVKSIKGLANAGIAALRPMTWPILWNHLRG